MSETLDDIVAAKRRLAAEMAKSLGDQHSSVEALTWEADRIEAAVKREREKTVAQNATVSGNAAAMREALVRVRDWLKRMNAGALQALAVSQITPAGAVNRSASGLIEDNDFYVSVCDAALSASPRKGKWMNGRNYEYEYAYCSECGRAQWAGWDTHEQAKENIESFADNYKFCPGCGVEMEGGVYVQ